MKDLEFYHFTDNGNGDRFADRNEGQVLLSARGGRRSYYSVFGDGRWYLNEGSSAGDVERRARDLLEAMRARGAQLKALGEAEGNEAKAAQGEALIKYAHACDGPKPMRAMVEMACLSRGMVTDAEDVFDKRLDLLATPSSVLELHKTGIVKREILASDMITMSTGVEWDAKTLEGEPPALLSQYFDTFIPDGERRRLIFKALGSALLGGNPGRLLLILKGRSTSGKTQLVEALRAALGTYAGVGSPSIFRGNLDDKPRPDVISVLRKRAVFLAEASKNWELHGDRVKAITGGDAVKVRRMRSDEFIEVAPDFLPVFYANEMPRVSGADQALKRRMLVMDFNLTPEKEDPTVKQAFLKCQETRKYLLALLVQGCVESMNEGLEDVKDMFASFTVKSFDETTHLGEFFEWLRDSEQLEEMSEEQQAVYGAKSSFVKVKAMHERYKTWVETHGNKQDKTDVLNYREFNAQLRDNYGWASENVAGLRWTGKRLKDFNISSLS